MPNPQLEMEEENTTMVAIDKTMLETTMKSSTVSSSTTSKALNNSKNLKWRWNKIKGKITNKNSYDSNGNNSISTGDTETMNTKTTIDDDEELSSRHSITNSTSFGDSSCATASANDGSNALAVVTTNSSSTVKLLKESIIPYPYDDSNNVHVSFNNTTYAEEEEEFVGLNTARTEDSTNSTAIATNKSIEYDLMETNDNDNMSQNSSDIETQQLCDKMNDENNDSTAMIPANASEIFSYNNEMEVASSTYDTGGSICDYRYIKRTKSFIGSEVLSMCGHSTSVRNSCFGGDPLAIESGGVITTDENGSQFSPPHRFRFSSNDYLKGWNFSTPTTEIKEVSERCLLDNELSDDEGDDDDDVKFLPIQEDNDDDNNNDTTTNTEKRKRTYFPLVAVASNQDGCIEAVKFDDDSTSYRVSASVEEMDDYDQEQSFISTTEEPSTLEYQNSSFFNCGLEFCHFKREY